MTIQNIKRKATPILERRGVNRAALFGSTARGEAKKNSDIDLLVKLKKGKTLFDIVRLKLELEKKLGRKVDLVEYDAIRPLLKKTILNEQKVIYERKKS
ncbi:hypothetical protein A2Z53_02510 [Candidatus Giovannonibacteria bacterium RIFCSPHIGHO2_02_42_15]|uniref:Polymerase beta nucleotidyltransferase domain-containing protein n=1 Tax=Candidatus Giovannonibacteria bacterium RIFCSPHIGHO2_02_42_15 TaxID=1798329 RepID=A0A1F5VP97_9BACT|nr:MAG: hypothetical protein A2Z53_02510 [Candidatus Giovannonibacteria bacterium RIFCSPHIGHO2_02_42_15]